MNLVAKASVIIPVFMLGACANWPDPIADEPAGPPALTIEELEGEVEKLVDASEEAETIVEESDEAEFIVEEGDEAETIIEIGDEAEAIIGAVDSMDEEADLQPGD